LRAPQMPRNLPACLSATLPAVLPPPCAAGACRSAASAFCLAAVHRLLPGCHTYRFAFAARACRGLPPACLPFLLSRRYIPFLPAHSVSCGAVCRAVLPQRAVFVLAPLAFLPAARLPHVLLDSALRFTLLPAMLDCLPLLPGCLPAVLDLPAVSRRSAWMRFPQRMDFSAAPRPAPLPPACVLLPACLHRASRACLAARRFAVLPFTAPPFADWMLHRSAFTFCRRCCRSITCRRCLPTCRFCCRSAAWIPACLPAAVKPADFTAPFLLPLRYRDFLRFRCLCVPRFRFSPPPAGLPFLVVPGFLGHRRSACCH